QADVLQNPSWPDTALQPQIAFMLQDTRGEPDNPATFSLERLYELAFENSPLRHRDESTLRQLSRKQVLDFYKRWYIPSNIVLIIAGSLDRRNVLEEVVKRYAYRTAADRVALKVPTEAAQTKWKHREPRGDVREGHVQIGFPPPAAFPPAWYA